MKLWTDLLEAFLNDPSLRVTPITVKRLMMSDYNTAGQLLAENLRGENEVVINIGGGVKAIALSIWTYAIENNWQLGWEVIYPNMEEKCIDIYSANGHSTEILRAELKLGLISKLYDHKVRQKTVSAQFDDISNHFDDFEFRMAFYQKINANNERNLKYSDSDESKISIETQIDIEVDSILQITNEIRKDLYPAILSELTSYHANLKKTCYDFQESLKNDIKKEYPKAKIHFPPFKPSKPNLHAKVTTAFSAKNIKSILLGQLNFNLGINDKFEKYKTQISAPIYFEKIVQNEVLDYINLNHKKAVFEAHRNVEIIARDKNNNDGEHDILLNLYNGQLISLDAKTFASNHKDLLSRIKRLENLAGIYTRFAIIIPYFWEDFTSDNLEQIEYLKKLQVLPFFFDSHKISFCVYNHTAESFYITQADDGISRSSEPSTLPGHRSVKILHYTHFLNQLLSLQIEKNIATNR
ncbi:MAG TPA: hypothetical protein PK037_01325 [Saprospiraceae bacterium]|nr:hypothetical protein [Saprospiraceae bacterium]